MMLTGDERYEARIVQSLHYHPLDQCNLGGQNYQNYKKQMRMISHRRWF
jgi:hypothetical protein